MKFEAVFRTFAELLCLMVVVRAQTPTGLAEYTCVREGDDTVFTMTSNTYEAWTVPTDISEDSICKSTFNPATGLHALVIRYDSSLTQLSPDPNTSPTCHVEQKVGTELQFRIGFMTTDTQGVVTANYFVATVGSDGNSIACDVASSMDKKISLDNALVTVASVDAPNYVNRIEEVMACVLQKQETVGGAWAVLQAGAAVIFSDKLKVECTYTHPDISTASAQSPKSAYFTHMSVANNAAGDGKHIIIENGCPIMVEITDAFFLPTTLTIIDASSDTVVVLESGGMKVGWLPPANDLHFFLEWESCTDRTDAACQNPDSLCTRKRRKRAAGDSPVNGTTTLATRITLRPGSTESSTGLEDKGSCEGPMSSWIVPLVLGILLFVLLLFAVYLFFRLAREQKVSRKLAEATSGHPNPAYG